MKLTGRDLTLKAFLILVSGSISIFNCTHIGRQKFSTLIAMKEVSQGLNAANEEEFASQSTLLKEFSSLSTIDKAWVFESENGGSSRAMFLINQPNLLGNDKRTHLLSSHISKQSDGSVSFQWAPFPVEMSGVSTIVPSPSGQKMLVIRNQENDGPTQFEIWGPSQVDKEIHIPKSVHGSVYTDGWFEGISWSSDETLIAYVAEDPCPSKPVFDGLGYKRTGSSEKDCNSWKGQGDFEEEWGEAYSGKRRPELFVVNIVSGEVHIVDGIPKSLNVGQVVWAPKNEELDHYLVFVGWPSDCGSEKIVRKLGIKYCYNRPCALYAVKASVPKSQTNKLKTEGDRTEDETAAIDLTRGISSAFFPRFSPDGKSLVFLSAKSAVDTGAHSATNSLHRIDWPTDGKPNVSLKLIDVVPVVKCAEDDCFPGLYCPSFLRNPWLSDGQTMIMSSYWRSSQVIISVHVLSGKVSRVTPKSSDSWDILALDGDNILFVSSSPVEPPEIKYGYSTEGMEWNWLDISSPVSKYSTKVRSMLSSLQFSIMKIPVRDASVELTDGARTPYEAIFVSSKIRKSGACDPLIVILHGGPHFLILTNFIKNHAFLSALGYSLLIVNYRGSLGFGEEALQSILGNVGSQDVYDVLAALDHVIEMGLADPSKVAVFGGSHGGFLTTHLIGQAPDRFVAAAARNPVCNLALMVGTTDIPDWCYVLAYGGSEGKDYFTEAPSLDHLYVMYNKSPISHLAKVKTPTLFLLGAQDLRVPVSNGLQYARALKENGVEVKVIVFPKDTHGIDRPQSDFESFLNIGVWFNKHFQ
ncbi:acylamino-acid-releasing enzyme 1-like isoform X1 [Papaver somniferum]|uniref:acylamino-acid-releasing enzyme 1-like isoform X1 n=2 Tax=Papaver somniferum TaxID=3469 RepID=UPI000E6F52F5|nr:acylamino-acid-releasing enzyme 1-like isoform X1 [Papaver somniferum]